MTKNQLLITRLFRISINLFMLALVLAMYPHTPDPTGDIKDLLITWYAVLVAGAWMLAAWRYKIPFERPRIFFELACCFLVFLVIAAVRSPFFMQSFFELSWFGGLFVIYLVATQVYHTMGQVRCTLLWVCTAVALASVYGFMQLAGLDPFPWGDRESELYTNLPATFGNPNYAAHALVLAIVLGVYLAWSWRYALPDVEPESVPTNETTTKASDDLDVQHAAPRRGCLGRMNWPILLLVLLLAHLYQTSQRAGVLALAGALALVLVAAVVVRRFKSPAQGIVISLLILGALGGLAMGGAMTRSYMQTGSPFPLDTSILLRYQSYVSATRMIMDKPVFGHGPGVYAFTNPDYWTQFEQEYFAQELRMNAHVHNDLLELAVDAGLPAAGLFLAMQVLGICYGLLLAFTARHRQYRYFGFALAAFVMAFLIDGLFGFNLRLPVSATMFFLLIGMLEGLHGRVFAPKAPSTTTWLPAPYRKPITLIGRVVLLVLLSAFLIVETRSFASQYALQRGLAAELAGNHRGARLHFREAETLAPWDHYMPRRQALLAIREGELEEAITHLERALETNPYYFLNHLPMAHTKLRLAHQHMVRQPGAHETPLALLDSAAGHVTSVLDFSPMLANAEELMGRIAFYSALCVESSALPDRTARARAYRELADTHFSRALELGAPNASRLYAELARLRMTLNDIDGAEEALVRAAQAEPRNVEVWPQFLEFAHAHDRFERMRSTLEALIDRLRSEGEAAEGALIPLHLWLASTLDNGFDGEDEAIIGQYRQALRLRPAQYETWVNFARYAFQNNRSDVFLAELQETVALLTAEGATVPGTLAAVNAILERGHAALDQATMALLAQVRSHSPESALQPREAYHWAAQYMLNTTYQAQAAAQREARDDVADVAMQSSALCGAYMNLGIIYATFGDWVMADQLFSQAADCIDAEREASLALHWADTLISLEQENEALALLEETLRGYPDHLDVRWALARLYGEQGRIDDARVEYDRLLALDVLHDAARERLEMERNAL